MGPQRTWAIQIAAAAMTGAAVWAYLAWRDYPQALLLGAVSGVITLGSVTLLPTGHRNRGMGERE